MPQLDPATFAPQLIWLAISFIVLYLLMKNIGLPKVGRVIEQRRTRIGGDLAQAASVRHEAEAVLAAYERALSEARAEAQQILHRATEQFQAIATSRQGEVTARLAEQTNAAERRIAAAKNAALGELGGMATQAAQEASSKLLGAATDEKSARDAVAAVLKERG